MLSRRSQACDNDHLVSIVWFRADLRRIKCTVTKDTVEAVEDGLFLFATC